MPRSSALLALVVASCSKPQAVAVAPDPSAAASTPARDAATPPDASALPEIDRRCSKDADCDWVAVEVTGPNTCCPSCGTVIASRTWTTAVRSICAKAMPATCSPLACPLGPTTSRCDAGTCVPKL